jgi:hypothetical protein
MFFTRRPSHRLAPDTGISRRDRARRLSLRSKPSLETMETRQLMTAATVTPLIPLAATYALGSSFNFTSMEQTLDKGTISGPQTFQISLPAGQILTLKGRIDYNSNPSTPDPYSTLTVYGPNGNQIAYDALNGATQPDPDTGAASYEVSAGFMAPTTGTYKVVVADNVDTSYSGDFLNLWFRPINLDTSSLNPNNANSDDATKLSFTGGGEYAFLNSNKTELTIAGPTGRGFQLKGTWAETTSTTGGQTSETYQSSGSLTLVTNNSLLGNITLPGSGFALQITTYSNGWGGLFGEVDTTTVTYAGQSLNTFFPFQTIASSFSSLTSSISIPGVSLSTPGLSWGIELGSSTLADTLGKAPLDPAVPYLYLSYNGSASASFGNILASTSGTNFHVAVDPQDPSFYLDVSGIPGLADVSLMFSQHGQIPYTPIDRPTTMSPNVSLWGDGFIRADINLASLTENTIPLDLQGDATINWDPTGIGATNAISNMFSSTGSFVQGLGGVQVGLNGTLSFAADFEVASITIPAVEGSLFYTGGELFFAYESVNPFSGTSVSSYLAPLTSYEVNGFYDPDAGSFILTAQGSLQIAGTTLAQGYLDVTNMGTTNGDTDLVLSGTIPETSLTLDLPGVTATVELSANATLSSDLTTGVTEYWDNFAMNGTGVNSNGYGAAFGFGFGSTGTYTPNISAAIGDIIDDTVSFAANSLEMTITNVDQLYTQLIGSEAASVANTVSNKVTSWIDSI